MQLSTKTVVLITLIWLGATVAACNDGDANTSTPQPPAERPQETATVVVVPTVPRGAPADGPTGPGPVPGRPCPVDNTKVCDFAGVLFTMIGRGDLESFIARSEPIPARCTGAMGFGGPSASLCRGATVGETRLGYWDIQGGEGLIVPEADWRRTLARWFSAIPKAGGSDVYGPGQLRVGSIACARLASEPSGTCSKGLLRIHFTFISPASDPSEGIGLPGQRTTFHVSLHETAGGELKIDGFGQSVPPNANLLSFFVDARTETGEPVVFQFYPWTP